MILKGDFELKEKLYNILMNDDVVKSINDNLDDLLFIIPEIKDMLGFEHKHPHHHLDVWNHTLLALSLSEKDFIIRLVLLFHDIGKPHSYQEGEVRYFKNHPTISACFALKILKRLEFSDFDIYKICCLIKEHDNPINDEEIVVDRDLALTKFKIQLCDALAHNPNKLEKRINYLLNINDKINNKDNQEHYKKLLLKYTG